MEDAFTTNLKLQAVLTAQWGYYGSTPSKSSFAIHALTVRHFWNGGNPHHDAGPKMRHTGEAVTFVPWKAFEKWKLTRRGNRDADYLKFKKEIESRLILQLKKHIPKLMDMVVHHELSTPLSTSFFTRAPQGAIYGLEATPKRFTSSQLRTRTPIKNLYLAGGDVATLGVTGAMVSGFLTAGTINPRVFSRLIDKPNVQIKKFLKRYFRKKTANSSSSLNN